MAFFPYISLILKVNNGNVEKNNSSMDPMGFLSCHFFSFVAHIWKPQRCLLGGTHRISTLRQVWKLPLPRRCYLGWAASVLKRFGVYHDGGWCFVYIYTWGLRYPSGSNLWFFFFFFLLLLLLWWWWWWWRSFFSVQILPSALQAICKLIRAKTLEGFEIESISKDFFLKMGKS